MDKITWQQELVKNKEEVSLMVLTREQRNIAHASGEGFMSSGRFPLDCVSIRDGTISATDGYIYATCPVEEDKHWLIPAEELLSVSIDDELYIDQLNNGMVELISDRYDGGNNFASLQKGSLPTYDKVRKDALGPVGSIEDEGINPIVVGLNPILLRKILDVVGDEPMIVFRICGPQKALEFRAGEITGLIMPMVVDDNWWKDVV